MDQSSSSSLHQPASSSSGATRAGGDNLSTLSPTSDLSLSVADVISPEKYQRLATEYAKLRAQFAVLKKGILEEKAKNEELAESVKARDQAARRAAQETESLVFRNQQLTKRIAVLQSDIEQESGSTPQKRAAGFLFAGDASGGHHKHRSASNASNTSSGNLASGGAAVGADVIEEIHQELRSKLEENERLQELIRTLEAGREQELKALERRLKEEAEVSTKSQLETINSQLKAVNAELVKIKTEKSASEAKLTDTLKSLQETTASLETLKEENGQLKSRVTVAEKQVIAIRQNARLQAARSSSTLSSRAPITEAQEMSAPVAQAMAPTMAAAAATPLSAVPNGLIPRSGSFSGVIRSSGSFSRGGAGGGGGGGGIIRSGSLSINHSGSPALASLIASANSQLSQSTKDLGVSGGDGSMLLSTSPSSASGPNCHNYKDLAVRQRLITEFATKVAEITCALSTLHSNVSKKISILFALLNNSVSHLYFFDVAAFKEAQLVAKESGQSLEEEVAASVGRSEYVQNILRKFNDSLKLYDNHLVILEESIHQYLSAKIRLSCQLEQQAGSGGGAEMAMIEQELAKHGRDILEKFTDYVNYLNKINPYMSLCVALWCKNISEYDPENEALVAAVGLEPATRAKLVDRERRAALCAKHEQLATSVTNCIRIIGQIASQVKVLLSKSAQLDGNYLTVFNHLMHRVNALEKAFDETKTLFTSKLALEHDLGITVAADLLSVDDAILSSMVFFRKAIIDMRLMVEMHYFFFVNHGGSSKSGGGGGGGNSAPSVGASGSVVDGNGGGGSALASTSPMGTTSPLTTLSGQLIPEEDDEEEEEDEEEEDEAEEEDEDVEMNEERPTKIKDSEDIDEDMDEVAENCSSSPEKRMKMRSTSSSTTSTKASTKSPQQISDDSRPLQKELQALQAEKEQWTIETEWRTLKLAEEQRKVAELELKVQDLLTQKQQTSTTTSTTASSLTSMTMTTPSTSSTSTANQLPLRRANSNTNSLASNKSVDNSVGAAASAALAEQVSISSAASLKSPTLDCFGTVAYPAISATDQQQTVSVEALKSQLSTAFDADQQQTVSSSTIAYLQSQMTGLVNALQTTDAKAAALEGDCLSLRAQLLALAGEKADLESRISAHHQTMGRIEEEYQTSVENYEAQLRTMSEHLAELNEKLTGQRETIDILQYQQQQQQQQSGKTGNSASSAASSAASNVVKTFRRSFKKQ